VAGIPYLAGKPTNVESPQKPEMTSIERGKSNLDLEIEKIYLEQSQLQQVTDNFEKDDEKLRKDCRSNMGIG